MSNLNCVVISGNLTSDPEVRTTQGGTTLAKLRLAINDGYQSSAGEWVSKTHFVDCTAFGRTAEKIGKLCRKGQPLEIQGKLDYSSWEDDEGQRRSRLGIVILQMHLLPKALNPKPAEQTEPEPDAIAAGMSSNGRARHEEYDNEIPF